MKTTHSRELNKILLVGNLISKSIEQLMVIRDCDNEQAAYLEGFFTALVFSFSSYDNYTYGGETFTYSDIEPLIVKELKIIVSELGLSSDIICPVGSIVKNKH